MDYKIASFVRLARRAAKEAREWKRLMGYDEPYAGFLRGQASAYMICARSLYGQRVRVTA